MAVRHPTVLVGCGSYGWNVMAGLLASAGDRGLLTWEEPPGGGESPAARRLKGLSMLWVPDGIASPDPRHGGQPGAPQSPDILKDLFLQIEKLSEVDLEHRFREAVANARGALLSARVREDDPERLPFGLDVIVLARPDQAALGRLERLLAPVLSDLMSSPNLVAPPGQSARVLNCTQIFDFANFWDRSDAGAALRASVRAWIERFTAGDSAPIGRVYLVDGKAPEAEHDERWREQEVGLFLELLLFEGLRWHSDLRALYQRESFDRKPVAVFGIRAIERSTGLLSRLAAAHFATGWLEYLATREVPQPSDGSLKTLLDHCRPESLERALNRSAFESLADEGLRTLEADLLQIPMQSPRWVDELDRAARRGLRSVRRVVLDKARQRAQEILTERLHALRGNLLTAVTRALQEPGATQPLATVLRQISDVEQALEEHKIAGQSLPDEPEGPLLEELKEAHRVYMRERASMVNTEGLRWFWPLTACLVAAAITPISLEAVAGLDPPDPALPLFVRVGIEWLVAAASPVATAVLFLAAAWVVGAWLFQRAVERRIARALRFFEDPHRGRLADRLRAAIRRGPIQIAAQAQTLEIYRDAVYRLSNSIMRGLADVGDLLRERRRELTWLRKQLQEYLRMHEVEVDAHGRLRLVAGRPSALRAFIATDQSLDDVLQVNPPNEERFRDAQSRSRVFEGWHEQYYDTFLYPTAFLDRLSGEYVEGVDQKLRLGDAAESQRVADALVERLRARLRPHFQTGFAWSVAGAQAGPATATYGVLPEFWARLNGVPQALKEGDCQHVVHGTSPDRAYLIRVQDNIDPAWLV